MPFFRHIIPQNKVILVFSPPISKIQKAYHFKMTNTIRRVAILTSGGDAPGMNACIRAVTRSGLYHGLQIIGIMRGYEGLIDGEFTELSARSVSNIIHRGGTMLKSARSMRFKTEEGMKSAYRNLKAERIDGLIAIGGDGTFKGALEFYNRFKFPVIGIPGTIDNDLYGTDFTIGYDTAINTVVDAIDKIRDTASSHDRLFFIEVMGRDAGFIALRAGIAGGAEAILVPEFTTDMDKLIENLEDGWRRKKSSSIVIVAEGDEAGGAFEIANKVNSQLADKYDIRVTILGHIQRGGNPTCMDRVLASRLGVSAVEALLNNQSAIMVGQVNKRIVFTPLEHAIKHQVEMNAEMMHIAEILSY